jgi:carbamoyl-phosphate synthase/aspartate carbamoyltransferase/dihydroorotase
MRLPGLIDVHVHLRVPGGEHKEDFHTATAAALAGGFTTLLGMPNTQPPLVTLSEWRIAQQTAARHSLCDVFLYAGASAAHLVELPALAEHALALKLYLDETYGDLKVQDLNSLAEVFKTWPPSKVLAVHAEGGSVLIAIALATIYNRPVHICHVSRKTEIELIAQAKAQGLPITCEVTPHHLFLTCQDVERLGSLGMMRPTLGDQADVNALWAHINTTIDIIASDHAPHTLAEKQGANPPSGVPGLESTLPLMLTAVSQGRLSLHRLQQLLYDNPRRIFSLPEQPETWVEIDPDAQYTFPEYALYTKCGWSPFAGMEMKGRITRVVLRGKEMLKDGVVLISQ